MRIIVLTKKSQGNETVGECETIAREFREDDTLGDVYRRMNKLGNWDIIIPRNQEAI